MPLLRNDNRYRSIARSCRCLQIRDGYRGFRFGIHSSCGAGQRWMTDIPSAAAPRPWRAVRSRSLVAVGGEGRGGGRGSGFPAAPAHPPYREADQRRGRWLRSKCRPRRAALSSDSPFSATRDLTPAGPTPPSPPC